VDVHERLAQIRSSVENARAMPMSASAVVNRAELLSDLDALAKDLTAALADAQRMTADRDRAVADSRAEADRLVAEGRSERDRLVSDTEVYRVARTEAERLVENARTEAAELRRDTDEYVERRLADFEVTLSHTLAAVKRGRERLHGRSDLDTWGRDADLDDGGGAHSAYRALAEDPGDAGAADEPAATSSPAPADRSAGRPAGLGG
jgi:cell division septum initiation protein DivIVA